MHDLAEAERTSGRRNRRVAARGLVERAEPTNLVRLLQAPLAGRRLQDVAQSRTGQAVEPMPRVVDAPAGHQCLAVVCRHTPMRGSLRRRQQQQLAARVLSIREQTRGRHSSGRSRCRAPSFGGRRAEYGRAHKVHGAPPRGVHTRPATFGRWHRRCRQCHSAGTSGCAAGRAPPPRPCACIAPCFKARRGPRARATLSRKLEPCPFWHVRCDDPYT